MTRVATVPPCPSCPRSRRSADSSRPARPGVASMRARWAPVAQVRRGAPHAIGAPSPVSAAAASTCIARLDDGRELIMHLGMTGRCGSSTSRRRWRPGTRRPVRPGLVAARRRRRARAARRPPVRPGRGGAGRATTTGLPTLAALGPEPLSDDFTPEHSSAPSASSRRGEDPAAEPAGGGRRRQHLRRRGAVAGPGRSHAARASASTRGRGAPHDASATCSPAGIDNGGTTLRDYRAVERRHRPQPACTLRCYGRAGQPCLRCGTALRRR